MKKLIATIMLAVLFAASAIARPHHRVKRKGGAGSFFSLGQLQNWIRSVPINGKGPVIVSPAPGTVLTSPTVIFSWIPKAAAPFYAAVGTPTGIENFFFGVLAVGQPFTVNVPIDGNNVVVTHLRRLQLLPQCLRRPQLLRLGLCRHRHLRRLQLLRQCRHRLQLLRQCLRRLQLLPQCLRRLQLLPQCLRRLQLLPRRRHRLQLLPQCRHRLQLLPRCLRRLQLLPQCRHRLPRQHHRRTAPIPKGIGRTTAPATARAGTTRTHGPWIP